MLNGPPPVAPDAERRRKYFEEGIDEFRRLLEREFLRTHPDGYYRNVPLPSGHDFRIHPKVQVNVTLEAAQSQAHATHGAVSRQIEQAGARGARGAAPGSRGSTSRNR